MKILFAIILCIIFLICFSVILFTDNPNTGIIAFAPVSFFVFVTYFGVVFLNLEISSKTISIKKRVQVLENSNKELKLLTTSLYKLVLISLGVSIKIPNSSELVAKHKLIQKDIEPYLDADDLLIFLDELMAIKNKSPKFDINEIIVRHTENMESMNLSIEKIIKKYE